MKKPTVNVLIAGIPLKTSYGGLGYCSVTLIIDGDRRILFDTGHYGVRGSVAEYIRRYHINTLFISHLHFDHCLNADLFIGEGIQVYVHEKEIERLKHKKARDVYTFYPFSKIVNNKNLTIFEKGFSLSPNVSIVETPGHTAGHSSLVVKNLSQPLIVAGDAIKTYKDFVSKSKKVDPTTENQVLAKKTKQYIKKNFPIIIPGHDAIIINNKRVESVINFIEF